MTFKKSLRCAIGLLFAFLLWLVILLTLDVRPIGPENTSVGLAGLNGWFHSFTGVHMSLYDATDILEFLPVLVGLGFAVLGLRQLIQRKNLWKVDADILCLGGLFITVGLVFAVFEGIHINDRPVLIDGALESSFPSSTTMLVMTVAPALSVAFGVRMKNQRLLSVIRIALWIFTAAITVLRTVSGVHWLSDIIGGALMSACLVFFYIAALEKTSKKP